MNYFPVYVAATKSWHVAYECPRGVTSAVDCNTEQQAIGECDRLNDEYAANQESWLRSRERRPVRGFYSDNESHGT